MVGLGPSSWSTWPTGRSWRPGSGCWAARRGPGTPTPSGRRRRRAHGLAGCAGRRHVGGPGEQAIAEGWFGPDIHGDVRPRVGDVVAAAFGPVGVVQRDVDPAQPLLPGHHGSLTPAEQLVPFLEVRR